MGRITVNEKSLEWEGTRWKGCLKKTLGVVPDTGATAQLFKIEAGCAVETHKHPCAQQIYIISGKAETSEGEVLTAGTYVFLPPGEEHGFRAMEECLFFESFEAMIRVE